MNTIPVSNDLTVSVSQSQLVTIAERVFPYIPGATMEQVQTAVRRWTAVYLENQAEDIEDALLRGVARETWEHFLMLAGYQQPD